MTNSDRLLSEFIDEWNAGRRPQVDAYVERAPEGDRTELAEQISAFLEWAPTPRYEVATLDELLREPAVQAVAEALDEQAELWPRLLPALRERSRLSVREVAGRLTRLLRMEGGEAKAERYLRRMEQGELEPAGVSQRVLDALGRVLGISGGDLARSGDFASGFGAAPAPASAAPMYRRSAPTETPAEDLEMLADALAAEAPAEMDEIDRLFTGGR